MPANTTSIGDHMYTPGGVRVSTLPAGAGSSQVFVANLTSVAVLAGNVLRGATISGVLRKIPAGTLPAIRWGGTDAVLGAEVADGAGRVQVPFTVTKALRGAPYLLFPTVVDAVSAGISVSLIDPAAVPLPAGMYVTVYSSTVYYSPKPSFSIEMPPEVAAGASAEGAIRLQYLNGDRVDGQVVSLSNSTTAVALSFNGSPPANTISPASDGAGEIRFTLHGVRAAGDAITALVPTPGMFSPALNVVMPINGSGVEGSCVVVPAAPEVPSVPGYLVYTPQLAWDAGARSVEQLDGDVELSFAMDTVVGVIVGLCAAGTATTGVREEISHGLYMFIDGGRPRQLQVYESGERVGAVTSYTDTDTFYIRRIGDRVIYSLEAAGTVLFRYASRTALTGPVEAVSALYASGDLVA